MWVEIDLTSLDIRQEGLSRQEAGKRCLYVTPGCARLTSIRDLKDAEYAIAVEIDRGERRVSFGRDYLGLYPLVYAVTRDRLFLSDIHAHVADWLRQMRVAVSVSEEALGLYFAAGYVPHGQSIFEQLHVCENVSLYHWKAGVIRRESLFEPISEDDRFPLAELGACIEAEVVKCAAMSQEIDVWCSGGIDSSVMAHCFNSQGRKADLLTLGYGEEITSIYGDGEIRFVKEMQQRCGAPIRYAELDWATYRASYDDFTHHHLSPVIDPYVPAKYALAAATRNLAITGEGGDPLFAGVKNNMVLYVQERMPTLPFGWLYALSHHRFAEQLEEIFVHGTELKSFVSDYFERQFNLYPGSTLRRLFYMNTLGKQGGLIFPTEHYAAGRYGIQCRHPLTALSVYNAAFRLTDDKKYRYPLGKLALIDLYRNHLPTSIMQRKKSGTRLSLNYYVERLIPGRAEFPALAETALFRPEFLARMADPEMKTTNPMLIYALHTLNAWLTHHGENEYEHAQSVSAKTDHFQRPDAGATV